MIPAAPTTECCMERVHRHFRRLSENPLTSGQRGHTALVTRLGEAPKFLSFNERKPLHQEGLFNCGY